VGREKEGKAPLPALKAPLQVEDRSKTEKRGHRERGGIPSSLGRKNPPIHKKRGTERGEKKKGRAISRRRERRAFLFTRNGCQRETPRKKKEENTSLLARGKPTSLYLFRGRRKGGKEREISLNNQRKRKGGVTSCVGKEKKGKKRGKRSISFGLQGKTKNFVLVGGGKRGGKKGEKEKKGKRLCLLPSYSSKKRGRRKIYSPPPPRGGLIVRRKKREGNAKPQVYYCGEQEEKEKDPSLCPRSGKCEGESEKGRGGRKEKGETSPFLLC